MSESGVNRKLAAIFSADVVGYGRLMQDDEAATVATLKDYRALIARLVAQYNGRVVNAPGDNILAEFQSSVEAVQAAVEIQDTVAGRNADLPNARRMDFRIGLNLGDVIVEDDGTIYGDGVNIAARMEALADAGGICVSDTVYQSVETKFDFGFDFIGEQQVKNVAKPVRVYRVRPDADGARDMPSVKAGRASAYKPALLGAAAAIIIVIVSGLWLYDKPDSPAPDVQVAETAAEAETAVPGTPEKPSVAVLQFDNLSDDPDQAYFAQGIGTGLSTILGQFPEFRVTARRADPRFTGADPKEIAAELNVNFVLGGAVGWAHETVRVEAFLADAAGDQLWSNRYDRDLTAGNLFEIQDDIINDVLTEIARVNGVIIQTFVSEFSTQRTADLPAYQCVLRSWTYHNNQNPADHSEIRDCLEKAVVTDPEFVYAWTALAGFYLDEYQVGMNPRPNSLQRALDAAKRAYEIDHNHEWSTAMLAAVYFARHELDEFFDMADQTLDGRMDHPDLLGNLGWRIAYAGQWERGISLLNRTLELYPNHPSWIFIPLSLDKYRQGDYAGALDFARKIALPSYWRDPFVTTIALAQLGRIEEAQEALARMLELYPDFAEDPRGDCRKWNWSEDLIDHVLDGFEKAGLAISPEPTN